MPAVISEELALQTLAFPLSNASEFAWTSSLLAPLSHALTFISGRLGAGSRALALTGLLLVWCLLAALFWLQHVLYKEVVPAAWKLKVCGIAL